MGLGITVWLPVAEYGKSYFEEYFRNIDYIIPHLYEPFFCPGGFSVRLVLFEEEISGYWEDDMLVIQAKTNSAGPGYHAYVCELIDGIGIAPARVEDESGYFETRDFDTLKRFM